MAFGRAYPGTGSDPLFGFVYAMAVLLNMAPAVVTRPDAIASGILTAAHVLMLGKIVVARERAGRQRAEDLQRFEALQRQETERPPADHSPELAASRQD